MGDWKVKIKLLIPIVIVMLLFASTIAIAAKPDDLTDKAYIKGYSDEFKELLFDHFIELYNKIYEINEKEPNGIILMLESIGR